MSNTLNVLLVEDSENDAELLLRYLRRGGYDVNFRRVETGPDLKDALDSQNWDIIISDYAMPEFSAPQALLIVKERRLDVPFIIMSGTIGEESAVSALLAGANDFLLKDRPARLIPAVERELREAEGRRKRREAEKDLKRAEERFTKAFRLSPTATSISTLVDGRFIDVNDSFLKMLGYSREEVIGHTVFELALWADPNDRVQVLQNLHNPVYDRETRFRTKSGELREVLVSLEPIELDNTLCVLALTHDVTERKQAEKTIRESEARFRLLAQNSTDMISRLAPDGTYLYVSPASQSLIGYPPEELIGHRCGEFIHPDDLTAIHTSEGPIHNTWDTHLFVYRARHKDGHYLWFETNSKRIRDSQVGTVLEIQAASRDITERKRGEEALRGYNWRLQTLHAIDKAILAAASEESVAQLALQYFLQQMSVPGASIAAFDFEMQTCQMFVALSADMPRISRDNSVALDQWSQEDIQSLRNGSAQMIDDAAALPHLPCELQSLYEGGLHRFIRIPLNAQGSLIGTLNLAADNTSLFTPAFKEVAGEIAAQVAIAFQQTRLRGRISRHASELEQRVTERTAELQYTKERVEAILNNSSDAIMFLTFDGVIQQINPAFEGQFGYQIDEIYGQSLLMLGRPDDMDALLTALYTTVNTGQPSRLDFVARCKDGSLFEADMALAASRQGEKIAGLVCSIRDITEHKRAEQELRQAFEKQKELSDLKASFTSMVSHEFRTPLTVIRSSAEMLQRYADRMDNKKKEVHFNQIQSHIEQLVNLLNDVLILGRAESVDLKVTATLLNLTQFCSSIVAEMQLTSSTHHIELASQGEAALIAVDEKLMHQAITNLLSNAFKYSPKGGVVSLLVSYEAQQVNLQVRDNGIGIPESDQNRLFELFHRASNVGNISGTGLGLPIVKRAVEAHGGKITFESTVGVGTTFIITLPRRR